MKALAYQADPSSVPVGPPHRVSPAKASKKVINVEADIIEVIHFLFVYHTTVPKSFKNLIYKSWFSSNLINRRHERQPERLLFKAPLVLNRKTSQYHFHEIPHFLAVCQKWSKLTVIWPFSRVTRRFQAFSGSFISSLPFSYSGEILNCFCSSYLKHTCVALHI